MGFYESKILPTFLNLAMKNREMTRLRRQWIPQASGRVVEVGFGSGLNLPFYSPGVKVVGVDPSAELRVMAEAVAAEHNVDAEFVTQGGEVLPFEDNSFDSAVVTWAFCTIPTPEQAAEEIRRVLKPGGQLVFMEHGRSNEDKVVKWQNRLNPIWKKIGGGCNLNRRPDLTLKETGYKLAQLEEGYIPGPKWATYQYCGIAVPD
jgi:ubiquinone/menaquinone biosynthesis C-methylase UbiE